MGEGELPPRRVQPTVQEHVVDSDRGPPKGPGERPELYLHSQLGGKLVDVSTRMFGGQGVCGELPPSQVVLLDEPT
jgi:hypothetical protein